MIVLLEYIDQDFCTDCPIRVYRSPEENTHLHIFTTVVHMMCIWSIVFVSYAK